MAAHAEFPTQSAPEGGVGAWLAGYALEVGPPAEGVTMRELLVIELAICAAVIVVAAVVIVMRWRRGSGQPRISVEEWRGAVAELADEGMSAREVADVPGFSHDTMEPDLGPNVPADPEQAAETPVSGVADAELGSDGPGTEPPEPQAGAGAVTFSERIGGYYEEADRSTADYLAARGWPLEQGDPGRAADAGADADADAAPAAAEAAAEPTAHNQLAA